ncbi:MAG: aldo/keto reductase [Cyclobacterium sp.]|uniref:aldo/keto reductase n=1 Tax=unclassified Cyclobacterium TaxID=2615055 RepID=UPI0013D47FCC|nr:aldo/keto reductase [Cyclobacterium sp. SYSU L10401]
MMDNFNINRRKFISVGAALSLGILLLGKASATNPPAPKLQPDILPEWRNIQAGMAYRRLGNTGLMISEVVNGGDPVRLGNLRMTEIAMERGLNYLDMAPSYGNGECEESYGKIIDNSAKREKVFMTTKISGMGIIAMKAAMAVATQHKALQPIPEWRIQKVQRIVPGEMKAPVKA